MLIMRYYFGKLDCESKVIWGFFWPIFNHKLNGNSIERRINLYIIKYAWIKSWPVRILKIRRVKRSYPGRITPPGTIIRYCKGSHQIMMSISKIWEILFLVLLVGHNPTLEDAVQMLTDSLEVTMSLCVLARLNQQLKKWSDFKQKKTNLGKNLIELLRP